MPTVELADVTLEYEVAGPDDGDPVVLVCGLSEAKEGFFGIAPPLAAVGFRVITFDNRGGGNSSAPPAPYTIAQMTNDTLGLCDHLGIDRVRVMGYSLGGWIAETMVLDHAERVHAAVFVGSCNRTTAWEKVSATAARELAAQGVELSPEMAVTSLLAYLPRAEVQNNQVVELWRSLVGDTHWTNPGQLGQWDAVLDWFASEEQRTPRWSSITTPCLVLSFEHDIDSPPAYAKEAAGQIPSARFVEIPGAGHLGPMTHAGEVVQQMVQFFQSV
jgi:pimeloyl-ACP methyl ester carboxylesterase